MIPEILLTILALASILATSAAIYFGLRFFERAQLRHEEDMRNMQFRFMAHLDKLESKIKAADLKEYVENTQADEPNTMALDKPSNTGPMMIPVEQLVEIPTLVSRVEKK